MPTPALDFLEKVRTWQEADGASSGLPLVIPDSTQSRLDAILADMDLGYNRADLETRARRWLIGYHELTGQQGGLTPEQQRELDSIVTCIPLWDARQQRSGPWLASVPRLAWIVLAAIVCLLAGLGAAWALASSGNGAPPPAGPVAQAPPGPAQGPLTDQQQFRADWNVPASATADAGNPAALVWLDSQDQLYHVTPWGVPADDAGWHDTTAITAAVHGTQADVTDGDAIWTVTTGQPFVLSGNPQVIYRVLRDGTIQSVPASHGIKIRHHL
jgi:hypothetical protein